MADSLGKQLSNAITTAFNTLFKREFGQNGYDYISDTTATVGNWTAVKATGGANAVFTTLTSNANDNLDSMTLVKGDIVYGDFVAITLSSGGVIAYKR